MERIKMPTIKDIMAERHCSRNRAISLRALFEARMDEEYSRLTGKHFLETITPEQFKRNPSLATMSGEGVTVSGAVARPH